MQDGNGVWRQWFDNGQLFGEIPMVDGQFTGLQRGWDDSGYLMVERFWYRGKLVSKKRYWELQNTDTSRSIRMMLSRPSLKSAKDKRVAHVA
jgi:antitoxin component YwqK of YwqJK toxin-antitoxin module